MVAKHLIMVATLLDEDPEKALVHARAAKDRAGRVSVARETNGIAAYHAGEWKEAISELRASRRMSGGPGLLAVLADAERGLGRPEKALDVAREDGAEDLDPESKIELAIVVAGAHHDLGDNDEALFAIEEVLSIEDVPDVSRLRVSYAYADALVLAGRKAEAIEWFERAAELDHGDLMDIPDRLAELQSESE
ncbi:Tetratricopeptide repeat protein [Corynebacterium urogenitale]|uniref:Tetratricopeptide repeat protein n=2 Tax=Corynebacterium urogenitale TaxID=2487892 RepID=A0A5J6Z5K3_9CORY|nr:Tetratricopeptide repeat protein [Corynebacterium urogenitale]